MDDTNWENQPPHNGYRSYGPMGAAQPVPPMTGPGGPPPQRHRALTWAAGIAAAIALAAGGAIAGLSLSSEGAPSDSQAALLSEALSGTSSPAPALSDAPAKTAGAQARRVAGILRHLRGLHGEFTVRVPGGGFRELAFERGIIQAVSASSVTVRAADGTTWVWTVVSNTVVRKNGAKTTAAALASGDPVFAGGPETGAVRDARLIIVPKKRGAGQPGARQGSTSSPSAN
jgi:hypothetical protein